MRGGAPSRHGTSRSGGCTRNTFSAAGPVNATVVPKSRQTFASFCELALEAPSGRKPTPGSTVSFYPKDEVAVASDAILRLPLWLRLECRQSLVHNVPRLPATRKHNDLWPEVYRLRECSECDCNKANHAGVATKNWAAALWTEHPSDFVAVARGQLKLGGLARHSKSVGWKHRSSRVTSAAPSLTIDTMTMGNHHRRPIDFVSDSTAETTPFVT